MRTRICAFAASLKLRYVKLRRQLRPKRFAIVYSADRRFYYVLPHSLQSRRPTRWMETAKRPGEVPEAQRHGVLDGFVQIETHDPPPEVYHRRVLPFNFWKIPAGASGIIDENDPLYLDYAATEGWAA